MTKFESLVLRLLLCILENMVLTQFGFSQSTTAEKLITEVHKELKENTVAKG